MNSKKAVLVVSFGTSHPDTLEKNIAAIESAIAGALPDYDLFRAFTSTIIMKKLRQRDHTDIPDTARALDMLERDGYERVLIQPTHVINGEEYDKLCRLAAPYESRLRISFGTPLLTSVQDYKNMASALMSAVEPPADDEALVFMGHGTAHHANAAYALLEYMLHDMGRDRVLIGTVEGYPALEQIISRLREHPEIRRVRLQPLMVVAGDHAKNDMAGAGEDSWRSLLEGEGYEVSCVLRGLGEYPAVRELFAGHARSAAEVL